MSKNKSEQEKTTAAKTELSAREQREKKHKEWTQNKVDRAAQDDFNVISQRTRDTSTYVNLINANDNMLYALRMAVHPSHPRLNLDAFDKLLRRSREAMETLNAVNAEIAELLRWNYRPPRGFENPLKNKKQAEAKSAVIPITKGADTKHPANPNLKEVAVGA